MTREEGRGGNQTPHKKRAITTKTHPFGLVVVDRAGGRREEGGDVQRRAKTRRTCPFGYV
jgi:hypothetical protein